MNFRGQRSEVRNINRRHRTHQRRRGNFGAFREKVQHQLCKLVAQHKRFSSVLSPHGNLLFGNRNGLRADYRFDLIRRKIDSGLIHDLIYIFRVDMNGRLHTVLILGYRVDGRGGLGGLCPVTRRLQLVIVG